MSDTPRTDDLDRALHEKGVLADRYSEMRDHAKQLERDLNAAVDARAFWVDQAAKMVGLYVAKCMGLNEAQRIAQTPAPDTPKK